MNKDSPRYPYTFACDYLRMKVGDDYVKGLPSRAAMSHARSVIANVLGIEDKELAERLADRYLEEYGE